MRKTLIATVLITGSTIAPAATPIDGWYTTLFGGYTYLPDNVSNTRGSLLRDDTKYDEGYHAGIRIGYKCNPLRYEAEYTYVHAKPRQFKVNNTMQTGITGQSTANFIMGNLYYDLPELIPSFNPYLGVGLGYGYVSAELNSYGPGTYTRFRVTDDVLAYQGTVGLSYNFAEGYSGELSYRYVATDRADAMGKVFQAHLASIGIVFRFDGYRYK